MDILEGKIIKIAVKLRTVNSCNLKASLVLLNKLTFSNLSHVCSSQ